MAAHIKKKNLLDEEDNRGYERCVICHELTDTLKDKHVYLRQHYVRGIGELCAVCYYKFFLQRNQP